MRSLFAGKQRQVSGTLMGHIPGLGALESDAVLLPDDDGIFQGDIQLPEGVSSIWRQHLRKDGH